MKKLIIAAGITALAVTSALAQSKNSGETKSPPQVFTDKAKIEGTAITGLVVIIDQPGFAVIHNNAAGAPPNSLGHIYVEPGETRGLRIDTAEPIDPASEVTVMLHYDTDGDNEYDFGPDSTDVDTPVQAGGAVVSAAVKGM